MCGIGSKTKKESGISMFVIEGRAMAVILINIFMFIFYELKKEELL